MDTLRRNLLRHLGVLLFYAVLTVIFTFPLALHLTDSVLGGLGDNLYFAWLTGWYEHAFFEGGGHPFFSPVMNWPEGWNLSTTDTALATVLPGAVFSSFLGPIAGYNLAMMLYGEFNVFKPAEARRILEKAYAALEPGGALLLEAHTFECVRELGQAAPSWYSAREGVFADGAYVCLMENYWHPEPKVAVERFYVLEAEGGAVSRYTQSIQAYEDEAYMALLQGVGCTSVSLYSSLGGGGEGEKGLVVIVGIKGRRDKG